MTDDKPNGESVMEHHSPFTIPAGSLEAPAMDFCRTLKTSVDHNDLSAAALLSVAISLKLISDAMEAQQTPHKTEIFRTLDGGYSSEDARKHPAYGISTAVRRPADDPPARKPVETRDQQNSLSRSGFWPSLLHSILHPSTDWIQEDRSHS